MPDQETPTDQVEREEYRLRLRNLRPEDYPDVESIMNRVYRGMGGAWTRRQFESQIRRFPEGQICIEDNGRDRKSVV